jgi:hypothetical protein
MKTLKVWSGRYSSGLIRDFYLKQGRTDRTHIGQGRCLVSAYTKKQAMEFVPYLTYSELTNYWGETGNEGALNFCKGKLGAWLFLNEYSGTLEENLVHTFHEEEIV